MPLPSSRMARLVIINGHATWNISLRSSSPGPRSERMRRSSSTHPMAAASPVAPAAMPITACGPAWCARTNTSANDEEDTTSTKNASSRVAAANRDIPRKLSTMSDCTAAAMSHPAASGITGTSPGDSLKTVRARSCPGPSARIAPSASAPREP